MSEAFAAEIRRRAEEAAEALRAAERAGDAEAALAAAGDLDEVRRLARAHGVTTGHDETGGETGGERPGEGNA